MRGLRIVFWFEVGSSMGPWAVVLRGGVTPRVTPVHAARGGTYGLEIVRAWKGRRLRGFRNFGLLFTAIDACEAQRRFPVLLAHTLFLETHKTLYITVAVT